jgi:RNA polymerase sigma factor (TIGR02999 family)
MLAFVPGRCDNVRGMPDELTVAQTDPQQGGQEWLADVYDCLRELATAWFRAERAGHTLQPTALVHEAYLRLSAADRQIEERTRFGGAAALAMRRVLVDHARRRNATKRGGDLVRLDLGLVDPEGDSRDVDVLVLDEALTSLAAEHERAARVVELRFFGGLTVDQAASLLDVSPRTIELDWRFARAWLLERLEAPS